MINIIYIAIFAIISAPFVVYFFHDLKFYFLYLKSLIHICLFKKCNSKKFSFKKRIQGGSRSPYDVGILPTIPEEEAEHPLTKTDQDGVHFTAVDFEQNFIDVYVNKIKKHEATVWILLRLQDGQTYSLSDSQDTRVPYIDHEGSFYSCGLKIQCQSPMRRWRISFNGLLKKDGGAPDDLVHVKFSFLWIALSCCKELNVDFCSKDLARSFLQASCDINRECLSNFSRFTNRYEQWGQLIGTLNLKGSESKEMYLWAYKTRISDFPKWEDDFSDARFYMYFKNGYPLKLEVMSIKKLLSNYASGYSVGSIGQILDISGFNSNEFALKDNSKKLNYSFKMDNKDRKLQIEFTDIAKSFYYGSELENVTYIRLFKVLLDDDIEGFGVLHHIRRSQTNSLMPHFPLMLLHDKKHESDERLTVLLGEDHCESSLVSGGKGCSLSLLTKLAKEDSHFEVSKGIVITTTAYEKHIESNPTLCKAIQELIKMSRSGDSESLKQNCLTCMKAFEATAVSIDLENSLVNSLGSAFPSLENLRFSVRSSACGEDSEDLSAAGQMLTILGVLGMNNILKSIIKCWSSKFGFEAVQYARQNGQPINSPMAVVIQEMVPSEVSGVMFTVDPVSGDPSHPYITANYGLGESVVSSLAEPDTIVLKRHRDQSISISMKNNGAKKTQIHMSEAGGTESKTLANDCESLCLTDEMAVRLGAAGISIESCFGFPLDIEWCFYKQKLFILQARPITTLHMETEFELMREQDTPTMSIYDFWTRANTGEVFLGATSPLGLSLIVTYMDVMGHVDRISRERLSYDDFCPYFFHSLPVTHRQVTLNAIDMTYRYNEKEINLFQKALEMCIFGRPVGTKKMHEAGIRKFGYKKLRYMWIFVGVMSMIAYFTVPKGIKKFVRKMKNYQVPLKSYTSISKTWNGLLYELKRFESSKLHGGSFLMSFMAQFAAIAILNKKESSFDTELYCDLATIFSASTDVESADVPERLQQLGKEIALNFNAEFTKSSPDIAYKTLKNDDGKAGELFRQFLSNHGHRCIKEFDLYSTSWGMEPESLIPILQNIAAAPNILNSTPKKEVHAADIISSLKTPLTFIKRIILKAIVPYAQDSVKYREKTKSLVIKCVDHMRQICHHLGAQMVEEGMLPDKSLIFFLTLEEISDIVNTKRVGLVSKAVRRHRLHSKLNCLEFPEIIEGIPKPNAQDDDDDNLSPDTSSISLTGFPVCQGKVKAKCRVVTSLDEAAQIKNGEILITHSTDTGWTPYFPLLSGVVTVLGGLISHGAVVAREYGLPCVVGVQKATSLFKTGDIVILDGTNGRVTKVIESTDL